MKASGEEMLSENNASVLYYYLEHIKQSRGGYVYLLQDFESQIDADSYSLRDRKISRAPDVIW